MYFKFKSFKAEITSTCELELPGGGSLKAKSVTLSPWRTPSLEIGANSHGQGSNSRGNGHSSGLSISSWKTGSGL